jgi:hypothetical protein
MLKTVSGTFNVKATLSRSSRVFLSMSGSEGRAGGIRTDSVIMTDSLATVLHSAVAEKLGPLSNLSGVDAALDLGCCTFRFER